MRASITRFRLNRIDLPGSIIIAHVDVRVGDIHIRNASIRVSKASGEAYVATPGRRTCGISISDPSPTRDAIEDAALARYRAETGHDPADPGGWPTAALGAG